MTPSFNVKKRVVGILQKAGITQPPVPIENLAKSIGARVQRSPLPDELSGLLYRKGNLDKPVIGVNSLQAEVRQRFTIAHELGHMLLHKDSVHVDRGFSVRWRDAKSGSAEYRAEIEANQFAAEILMPELFLRKKLGRCTIDLTDENLIRDLAVEYNVSLTAMIYRLTNLGYLPTE